MNTKEEEVILNEIHDIGQSVISYQEFDMQKLQTLLKQSEQLNFKEGKACSLAFIAYDFYIKANFKEALNIYNKALEIIGDDESMKIKGSIYNNMALVYNSQKERAKAISMLYEALKVFERLDSKDNMARVLVNISLRYRDNKDYKNAEKHLLDAQKIGTSNYLKEKVSVNLTDLYIQNKNYKKAIKLVNKELQKENLSNGTTISLMGSKGDAYYKLKKYKLALQTNSDALNLITKNILPTLETIIKSSRLKILFKLKQYENLKKLAFEIMEKRNINEEFVTGRKVYKALYKTYNKEKKYKNKFKYYKLYIKQKDIIEGAETKNHLASVEGKYQNDLKEKEKEILRLQKVEMEQKALRAQLNPHFFFNSLNSIHKFIMDNDKENATIFLQKFSSLMRKTLENSEETFITIEEEIEFLKDYLSLEQLRFNNSFSFEFIVDEEIEEDYFKIPTMMLQPYLENSIKHGLNGIKNGKINIELTLQEDAILCVIEDNGRGRGTSQGTHKSMGTNLLNERVKVFKEQYNLDFSVETIDLIDEKKLSLGTRVELVLPLLENI